MTYSALTKVGNVRVSEYDTVFLPNPRRPLSKFGCVLLHGSGAPREFIDPALIGSRWIGPMLANAGIPCISAEMSGQSWANDASQTDVGNALAYLATVTGVPSTKVHLLGVSMGGAVMIRYAENNPTKIASMQGVIPLCNIQNFYAGQTAPVKTEIETAWGVGAGGPLPAGANIHSNGASLAGIPAQFYNSSTDAVVSPADQSAFCTAYGIPLVNLGTNGHSETTIKQMVDLGGTGTLKTVIDFMLANGA